MHIKSQALLLLKESILEPFLSRKLEFWSKKLNVSVGDEAKAQSKTKWTLRRYLIGSLYSSGMNYTWIRWYMLLERDVISPNVNGVIIFAWFFSACKRQTLTRDVRWMTERRWRRIHSGDWAVSIVQSVSKCMWVGVFVIAQPPTSLWCPASTVNQQQSNQCSPKWIRGREVSNRSATDMAGRKGIFKQKDAVSQHTLSTGANPSNFPQIVPRLPLMCCVQRQGFPTWRQNHATYCL